jgi:hypothetical protein
LFFLRICVLIEHLRARKCRCSPLSSANMGRWRKHSRIVRPWNPPAKDARAEASVSPYA